MNKTINSTTKRISKNIEKLENVISRLPNQNIKMDYEKTLSYLVKDFQDLDTKNKSDVHIFEYRLEYLLTEANHALFK